MHWRVPPLCHLAGSMRLCSASGVYTAVRLAAALGTSERFWLGLQDDFDLEEAHRVLGKAVDGIERIAA